MSLYQTFIDVSALVVGFLGPKMLDVFPTKCVFMVTGCFVFQTVITYLELRQNTINLMMQQYKDNINSRYENMLSEHKHLKVGGQTLMESYCIVT